MKKVVYIILIICLLIPQAFKALEIPNLNSKNVIIYNLDEEKMLYEKNADEKTSIASLTKIMTTILAIENIEDLNEKVTVTSSMLAGIYRNASVAGIKVGDTLTYEDLLYSSMLPSGADATQILAISLTGSADNFVKKMNEKAAELGMEQTHFVNTTGLDAAGHYSSAKDILTLLKYSLQNETFKKIYETQNYTTSNNLKLKSTLAMYNEKLNYDLTFIKGSKTGYTDDAGYCLSTLMNIDNTNLITITIKAPTDDKYHVVDAVTIKDALKKNYSKVTLIEEGDILKSLKTKYAIEEDYKITSLEKITKYIEKPYDENKLKIEYSGEEVIKSNTKKGTEIGTIKISYDNELIKEMKITLDKNLHFSVWNYLKENIIYYIGLIIIVFITIKIIKKPKRKKIIRA